MADLTNVYSELERQAIIRAMQRTPINGKYYELWNQHAAEIGRFVKEQKLQQVTIVEEHAAVGAAPAKIARTDAGIYWWSKWGGMKAPHAHYADGIYAMTREQWATFTKNVTTTLVTQLQGAGQVSYAGFMEATDAIAHM
jgi:hypothetical protein